MWEKVFQNLVLHEGCRNLFVNTQKGLFQTTHLQYGEAFKPCTFYIIKNGSYSNIGGKDNEHKNLESVSDVVKKCCLGLKKEKCIFMASEVTCLGSN